MPILHPLEAAYTLGCEAFRGFPGSPLMRSSTDPLHTLLEREPTDEEREQYADGQRDQRERLERLERLHRSGGQ